MANFCANCGAQTGGNVTFCPQCGAPQNASPQAAVPPLQARTPPPPVAPTVKPSGGGGGLLKILLIVMVVGAALLILAGTGVYYAAHRIKQAVVAKVHHMDLPSSGAFAPSRSDVHVCELLPKDVVAKLIKLPVDHTESESQSCVYYGPPGLSAKLSQEQMSNQVNESGKPHSSVDGSTVADAATNLAGSIGQAIGVNGANSKETPLLTVVVGNDGKAQMTVLSASKALLNSLHGAGAEVPNLGDRAIRLGNLGLNVLKGDTIVRIVPGPIPDGREKCILIAREILPKV